ncbi:MAG: DUF3299 domain-containing protein [Cyanobacteria bacterium P01_D01_bin.56]
MYNLARYQRWWRCIVAFWLGLWLVVIIASPLAAQQTITWEDLEPQATTVQNPYAHLSIDQTHELSMLAHLQLWIEQNETAPETIEIQEVERLRQRLEAQGLDVEQLLTQVDQAQDYWQEQSQFTNQSLEQQDIQLSGYVLPLTQDNEQQVTEFLLVPYIGACIHVPPPPPNQMIYVEPSSAIEPPGLFAPVSVTGQLRQQSASYELFLVDGSRSVDVSYTLHLDTLERASPESALIAMPDGPIWRTLPLRVSAVLTQALEKLQGQRSIGTFLLGLLMAFSYGVLHTLGPGHGKAIIISYFVGRGGSLRRGLTMGLRIAIFHVLSAILVVLLTDTVIRQAGGSPPDNYRVIQLISYGAIAAIGAWLLWQALKIAPPHRPPVEAEAVLYGDFTQQVLTTQLATNACSCFSCIDPKSGNWLSLAIGAVPCSGALLVLLYGLANDLLWQSIAMVLAISAGMAITLSWIGTMAIMGRRYAEQRLGSKRQRLTRWVRILGAGFVLFFGLSLFGITVASGNLISTVL